MQPCRRHLACHPSRGVACVKTRNMNIKRRDLTLHRSAFEELIPGPKSSSRGSRQKRSYSASPAMRSSSQSESEVYTTKLRVLYTRLVTMWVRDVHRTPRKRLRLVRYPWLYERNDKKSGLFKGRRVEPCQCGHVYKRVWPIDCRCIV